MTDLHCPLCGSPEIVWKSKVLLWECNACQERFQAPPPDVEQASDPLVNQERALLSRAQALASHGDWQDRIRTAWPAPIAFTYQLLRALLKNGQIDAAAWVLKDLGELMARFPALVMARDILESGAPDQQQMVRQRLFGKPMAMGDWIRLADDLAREIQTHPESFMFSKIATLFRQGKQRQVLPGFLEALVTWRNETLGHGVRGEDAESTFKDLEGFLGQLPAGNAPKNLHSVLQGVADLWTDLDLKDPEGHSLIGAEAFRPEHSSSGEHHLGPVVPLILQAHSDDSRQLRLAPYIAVRRCAVCEQQETFHYDSIKDQRLVPDFRVLNYERGHATRIAVDQDPEMLADYNQGKPAERGAEGDFSGDALDARVAALLDEISIERSYLSPQYLRDPLKVWIESRRDQGVGATFWLRAPAHVGKSTFVRGLDPRYRDRFRESPLIDDLAVVVFYVRREYQYHIAQFADTLRDLLREELNLRAQNQLLPSLDLEDSHRPGALTHFLEAYQRLGNRPILIVVDGLDELGREEPGIADYLGGQPPENVFLLLTSRPVVDLAPWQRDKLMPLIQQIVENPAQGQNGDPALVVRDIGLQDQDYNALMDAYAERYGKGKVTPEIREMIKEKSDGRFLYFAFLVSRVADGGLKKEDLAQLQDPATLVPRFVQSLLGRYQDSPLGDLIQRTLLHLVAAENAYIAHNQNVPPLFQLSWNGLPMEVLCLLVEGNQEPTTRFVQVLYLLKPLLGTWRGADSGAFYRLGIKGLREDLAQNYAPDITRLQDYSVRQVLEHMEALDQSAPETLLSQLPADQEWTAEFLDGRLNEASEILWKETVLRHSSDLKRLLSGLFARGMQKQEQGFYRDAMQRYSVYIAILEILRTRLGEQFPPDMADDLANAYMNRGNTLDSGGDLQGALADYGRTIAIQEALRTRLGEQFPPNIANGLANAYMNRGTTLDSGGDMQGALAHYGRAIDRWESMRTRLGEQLTPDMADGLAGAYMNRGATLDSGGDMQGALADYGRAIDRWESLRTRLGEQLTPNMADHSAIAYINRGNTLYSGGDLQGALADYGRAIAIREALRTRLGEQFPPNMADGLAKAYINRGATLDSGGDLQGALADYGRAMAIREALRTRLGEQFTPSMADGLASAYMNRGATLESSGDLQGALADYGRAIAIREALRTRLGEQLTPNMADGLADAYMNRGTALKSGGDLQGAPADYGRAIDIWESMRSRLGEQFPPDMADSLAIAYINRCDAPRPGGDLQAVLADYGQAITILENIHKRLGDHFTLEMADHLSAAQALRREAESGK